MYASPIPRSAWPSGISSSFGKRLKLHIARLDRRGKCVLLLAAFSPPLNWLRFLVQDVSVFGCSPHLSIPSRSTINKTGYNGGISPLGDSGISRLSLLFAVAYFQESKDVAAVTYQEYHAEANEQAHEESFNQFASPLRVSCLNTRIVNAAPRSLLWQLREAMQPCTCLFLFYSTAVFVLPLSKTKMGLTVVFDLHAARPRAVGWRRG